METYVKGRVRVYIRNIKRKLKNGKQKTYQAEQHQVLIDKTDILTDGQEVAVIPLGVFLNLQEKANTTQGQEKDLNYFQKMSETLKKQNTELLKETEDIRNTYKQEVKELKDTHTIQLQNIVSEKTKLETDLKHTKATLNKANKDFQELEETVREYRESNILTLWFNRHIKRLPPLPAKEQK